MRIGALILLLAGTCHAQQAGSEVLQDVWRGTRPYGSRCLLIFGRDIFGRDFVIGPNVLLGIQASTYTIDEKTGTIDIDRADGRQLGIYWLYENKLKLVLGEVNGPRPDTPQARGFKKTQYVFERLT
jgi:hypothetical protein